MKTKKIRAWGFFLKNKLVHVSFNLTEAREVGGVIQKCEMPGYTFGELEITSISSSPIIKRKKK